MCLAVDDHKAITKGIMRQVFSYAFNDLKVRRITNACSANNLKAIAINRRAGMVQEGIMRCAHPDGSDLIIFGMLRHECKYLEQ
jgi:RimJ/RimL family protein N-acetyltransferase